MNTSVELFPALFIGGKMVVDMKVVVSFEGYDAWSFDRDGWMHRDARHLYNQALRFIRLVERGYAPLRAMYFSDPIQGDWEMMEQSLHDKLTDERVDALPIDCPDMMFTDPLTPADQERLYAMWLLDGDGIFHFDPALSALWDIPALLGCFRALAQSEDEKSGSWSHSHHLDPISY